MEVTGAAPASAPLVDGARGASCSRSTARAVFGAALLWLIYDIVLYSGVLFGPSVIAGGMA